MVDLPPPYWLIDSLGAYVDRLVEDFYKIVILLSSMPNKSAR